MNSIFDNGGFIGRTADYNSLDFYPGSTTLTYLANYADEAVNITTKTWTGVSFGTPSEGRYIIVAIGTRNDTRTISSVTIGGVSATIIVQNQDGNATVGIAIALVPTGTSGDVAVTLNNAADAHYLGVWSVTGLPSATPVATAENDGGGGAAQDLIMNTSEGGFAIVAVCNAAGGNGPESASTVSTNLTLRFDGESTTPAHNTGMMAGADGQANDGTTTTFSITPGDTNGNSPAVGATFQGLLGDKKNSGIWSLSTVRRSKVWTDPDLNNASYDNVSFEYPFVGSITDVFFKPDGLSFYISDASNSVLQHFDLTTPWDLNSAAYQQSVSLTTIQSIFFKPDGTRIYWVNNTLDTVNQADLSTPWDPGTIGTSSTGAPIVSSIVRGIRLSSDGTKMYAADRVDGLIEQFNLGTAWDITSPSASSTPDATLDVSTQSLNPYIHSFNPNGTKMWVTSISNDNIAEYNLSTAWEVSTGTYSGSSLSLSSQASAPQGGAFRRDGSKLYVVDTTTARIFQYSTKNNRQSIIRLT